MFAFRNCCFSTFSSCSFRSFATLKDIQLRLKSVKNIEKITKSMKMIAGTKLAKAQKALEVSQAFTKCALASQEAIKIKQSSSVDSKSSQSSPHLFLVCSSDRGLCGAIHSSLAKTIKNIVHSFDEAASNESSTHKTTSNGSSSNVKIVVLGDKAKTLIARECKQNILYSFSNIGRATPTFWEACQIVEQIRQEATQFPRISILYNKFISVLAYESSFLPVYGMKDLLEGEGIKAFEFSESQMENYALFQFACSLYGALMEGHVAEMSAKRTSMDNATKNAGEIIGKLTMTYNRTRQSVITNELVDIITGAAAL